MPLFLPGYKIIFVLPPPTHIQDDIAYLAICSPNVTPWENYQIHVAAAVNKNLGLLVWWHLSIPAVSQQHCAHMNFCLPQYVVAPSVTCWWYHSRGVNTTANISRCIHEYEIVYKNLNSLKHVWSKWSVPTWNKEFSFSLPCFPQQITQPKILSGSSHCWLLSFKVKDNFFLQHETRHLLPLLEMSILTCSKRCPSWNQLHSSDMSLIKRHATSCEELATVITCIHKRSGHYMNMAQLNTPS